jgi:hypothetical protein
MAKIGSTGHICMYLYRPLGDNEYNELMKDQNILN